MKKANRFNENVFVINNESLTIQLQNYGSLVREFADKTTTPNGVAPRCHIRNNNEQFELWTWGILGNHPRFLNLFSTEREAEYALLETFEYDMANDDQVIVDWFYKIEDAEKRVEEIKEEIKKL